MSQLNSIDMLDRLVAFPTVSRDSNLPLIDWVEEYLEPFGARCRRTPNDDGTKANLFAAIGPDAPGGVVLSGHTDVVPVAGQAWSSDPFALVERDGRLHTVEIPVDRYSQKGLTPVVAFELEFYLVDPAAFQSTGNQCVAEDKERENGEFDIHVDSSNPSVQLLVLGCPSDSALRCQQPLWAPQLVPDLSAHDR